MGAATTRGTAAASAERRAPRTPAPILVVGVCLSVVAGVVLRFWALSDLWADEVLSVNIARLPVGEIPEALRHDGAPPLYYLLLHGWMKVFGTGNAAVRSLSGVFGVLTLIPMWFIGRRLDERRVRLGDVPAPAARTVAWCALGLMALSPFAIRYSTEARMYALVILLSACGYLAVARVFDAPTAGRLTVAGLIAALLLYSHYWAFSLLAVLAAGLVGVAAFGATAPRRAAGRLLVALVVSALAFVPWLPSFVYQLRHTGTPWGAAVSPIASWAVAFKSFGGNAHAAGWMLVGLILAGLTAAAVDHRHVMIDLATRRGVRLEAGVAFFTLGVGLVAARLSDTTFEGRYAAVVFPLFVVVGAYGLTAFASRRVMIGVLAIALLLGAWGGVSNAQRNRTQAYQLVPIIRAGAVPGDVIVYCPDAIGTDVVSRVPADLTTFSVPGPGSPARIDWVDYERRLDAVDPDRFARRVLAAADGQQVWFVYTDNGTAADQKCATIADFISLRRPNRVRELEPDHYFYEHHGLYRYPATAAESATG